MKHIFYIQSNISFLVAKGTLVKQSLSPEDCVFLYGRNFYPKELPDIFLNKRVDEWVIPIRFVFWKSWPIVENVQRKIDRFVEKEIGGSYILYTSSFIYYFIKYLKTKDNYEAINFLEEGSGAYFSLEERRQKARANKYKLRLYGINLFYILNHKFRFKFIMPNEYVRIFSQCDTIFILDDRAFTFTDVKKVLVPIIFDTEPVAEDIKHVIVPSCLAENKIVSKKVFLEVLQELMEEFIDKGMKKVHIKFHPYLYSHPNLNEYREFLKSFASEIEIVELDASVQTEDMLFNSKAHIYTDTSSVAIYAHAFGCKVTSYNQKIIQRDSNFLKYTSAIPAAIKNLYQDNNA